MVTKGHTSLNKPATFRYNKVIITCSTCCPLDRVRATWVGASFQRAASTAADDDFIVVETCTDPCGPNTVQRAASTAADNDFIVVETCADPCGPNTVQRAASTAADDDFILDT